ncbi:MAG: hypothetical protein KHZ98_05570 [Actinomyces sp.]|nr:hypothetical protein [Actinomyces sp.]
MKSPQILERTTKHAALLAAYDQLRTQPTKHFTPTQWTALIDRGLVTTQSIEFTFRNGQTIRIDL